MWRETSAIAACRSILATTTDPVVVVATVILSEHVTVTARPIRVSAFARPASRRAVERAASAATVSLTFPTPDVKVSFERFVHE